MIDAYEIGIQLLLQDDVSAGLEVINRELAEVDRAIAATSAKLQVLSQSAAGTTRAVAAAATAKPNQPTSNQQESKLGSNEAAVPASLMRSEADSNGTVSSSRQEMDAPAVPAVAGGDTQAAPQPDVPRPNLSATAPIERVIERDRVSERERPAGAAEVMAPGGEPHTAVAPLAERSRESAGSTPGAVERVAKDAPPAVGGRQVAVSVTAPTARAAQQEASTRQSARSWLPSSPDRAATRQRATAPWAGVEHRAPVSDSMRSVDRTAAPVSSGREHGEAVGGTVMLDGRLVGQWLSDHMARQASRPPGGTSFFDPRQSPAWNVSGAV